MRTPVRLRPYQGHEEEYARALTGLRRYLQGTATRQDIVRDIEREKKEAELRRKSIEDQVKAILLDGLTFPLFLRDYAARIERLLSISSGGGISQAALNYFRQVRLFAQGDLQNENVNLDSPNTGVPNVLKSTVDLVLRPQDEHNFVGIILNYLNNEALEARKRRQTDEDRRTELNRVEQNLTGADERLTAIVSFFQRGDIGSDTWLKQSSAIMGKVNGYMSSFFRHNRADAIRQELLDRRLFVDALDGTPPVAPKRFENFTTFVTDMNPKGESVEIYLARLFPNDFREWDIVQGAWVGLARVLAHFKENTSVQEDIYQDYLDFLEQNYADILPPQPLTLELRTDDQVQVQTNVPQPKFTPQDDPARIVTPGYHMWYSGSCWMDAAYVALFSIPQTTLSNAIFGAKTVARPRFILTYSDDYPPTIITVDDRGCTNDEILSLHNDLLQDIRDIQVSKGFTGESCRSRRYWAKELACVTAYALGNVWGDQEVDLVLYSLRNLYNVKDFLELDLRTLDESPLAPVDVSALSKSTRIYVRSFFTATKPEEAAAAQTTGIVELDIPLEPGNFRLAALICYTGGHYVAFVFDFYRRKWQYVDNLEHKVQEDIDALPQGWRSIYGFKADYMKRATGVTHAVYFSKEEVAMILAAKRAVVPRVNLSDFENPFTAMANAPIPNDTPDAVRADRDRLAGFVYAQQSAAATPRDILGEIRGLGRALVTLGVTSPLPPPMPQQASEESEEDVSDAGKTPVVESVSAAPYINPFLTDLSFTEDPTKYAQQLGIAPNTLREIRSDPIRASGLQLALRSPEGSIDEVRGLARALVTL